MAEPAPISLWQSPPCWGLPSTSPFCIKLEAWLRMAGLPYEARVLEGLPRSSNRKIPYVELPDGRLLCDSGVIIETLAAERGVEVDAGLSEQERAVCTAVTRLLEDHFYWALAWDRWIPPAHWAKTRVAYFGMLPGPLRWLVPPLARRSVRRAFHGQGFGRMPPAEIMARAERDLEALAGLLGAREHLVGRPASIDATMYAFLVSALRSPFDGPLQRAVARHGTLTAFCERFEQRWW
jgi:glutathione S-transferase